ncbi:hypothetical protein N7490_008512 [Penicillium lividum]|nr:hypothetical protein N7490_008512 [Penicillium lividum]
MSDFTQGRDTSLAQYKLSNIDLNQDHGTRASHFCILIGRKGAAFSRIGITELLDQAWRGEMR